MISKIIRGNKVRTIMQVILTDECSLPREKLLVGLWIHLQENQVALTQRFHDPHWLSLDDPFASLPR